MPCTAAFLERRLQGQSGLSLLLARSPDVTVSLTCLLAGFPALWLSRSSLRILARSLLHFFANSFFPAARCRRLSSRSFSHLCRRTEIDFSERSSLAVLPYHHVAQACEVSFWKKVSPEIVLLLLRLSYCLSPLPLHFQSALRWLVFKNTAFPKHDNYFCEKRARMKYD